MALIATLYGDISVCKCTVFAQDLLNLSKKILQEPDKKEQWEIFLCFQRQYLLENSRVISDVRLEYRSGNLCFMLLNRVEESKRSGVELPTLLLDLVANLYLRDCGQKCSRSLEQVYRAINFPSDSESLQILAAFYSEIDFMKLLVNFGHLSSLPEGSSLLRKATENIMLNFMWLVGNTGDTHSMFKMAMDLLKSFFRYYEEVKFYKKMFLVGIALYAIQLNLNMEYSDAQKYISCLRMYFSATNDPFLSIFEVRSVLYAIFVVLTKLDLFEKYAEEFDNLMPECPSTVQPRKLIHLSRFQIRQNLKVSELPLPCAVEQLHLPKIVKSFLVGDIDDFPSKTGNTPVNNSVTKLELERLFSRRPTA